MIRIDKNIFALMQYSRLIMLAGDDFRALGLIVRAWILGQTHWLKHKCIPSEYWPAELDLIIEAGFAHRDENGSVYLLGAEDGFKWLTQRSSAGKSFKNRKRNETKRKRVETKHKRVETKIAIIPEITHLAITDSWKVSLPNDLLRVWSETYPEEFLRGEVKKIRAWLLVNQHKAPKTRWGQFFNSWFIRAWEMQRKILNSNKVQAGKLSIEDIERMWDDDK